MANHSTVELHQGTERTQRVDAEQHLRIMIETMVRAGYTEPEITEAVETSKAPSPKPQSQGRGSHLLLGLFRR